MPPLMDSPFWIWVILLSPLLAFTTRIFFGRQLGDRSDLVSTCGIGLSLLVAMAMFFRMLDLGDAGFSRHFPFEWIRIGDSFRMPMGFLLDNMCVIMLFVVTLVSTLVHVYSMGYMKGDERYGRFFSFLSLFTFSMLWLIVADNLIGLYIGWELVGLSSYLLIGFWFHKPSAASASKKAFLTTRVGDVGMFLGIMMLYMVTGTFDYRETFQAVASGVFQGQTVNLLGAFTVDYLTLAGILLFMGAVGKSAQFPLHIWLPDAMEGPTPVSALIHAATMVAAGVYLVARMYLVFTPDALLYIAYTGGFTALFAATIALTANDIKKVLAYSTISQLGYMVLGLGVGGYTAGFFHLWTHAFFKALLFLGSGSVIVAMHHEQDMRHMGGLRTKIPVTFWTMFLATLAISGVPMTSGFFSKDAILGAALLKYMQDPRQWLLPTFGFCAAALTAFYMFRLIYMTFFGTPRLAAAGAHGGATDHGHGHDHGHDHGHAAAPAPDAGHGHGHDHGHAHGHDHGHDHDHAHGKADDHSHDAHHDRNPDHEGVMSWPLLVLAFMTLVSAGIPVKGPKWMEHYIVQPTLASYAAAGHEQPGGTAEHGGAAVAHGGHHDPMEHDAHDKAMTWSIFIATLGIMFSTFTYYAHWIDPQVWARRFAWLYDCMVNKWYIDELYEFMLVRPVLAINAWLARFDLEWIDGLVNGSAEFTARFCGLIGWIDSSYVDGMVNETANTLLSSGKALSRMQTGLLRQYLAWAVVGMVAVVATLSLFL